jgi:hypothetical protein
MQSNDALLNEILATITNPGITEVQRWEALLENVTALEMTASLHGMDVAAVWKIVQKMEDNEDLPFEEPVVIKTKEERIFWDYISEWEHAQKY